MATVTHKVTTADTGSFPNPSGAFTPSVGDLLVGLILITSVRTGYTLTNSVGTLTFSQVSLSNFGASSGVWIVAADKLVTAGEDISQTVTIDADPGGSGCIINMYSVSGITAVGVAAARQVAEQISGGAGTTPAPVFGSSVITTNPTLCFLANSSNPATVTPPSGWTEPAGGDVGYGSPTAGGETNFRDSGFTGTTVTWGSTSATIFTAVAVELDAGGAAAANPFFTNVDAQYI